MRARSRSDGSAGSAGIVGVTGGRGAHHGRGLGVGRSHRVPHLGDHGSRDAAARRFRGAAPPLVASPAEDSHSGLVRTIGNRVGIKPSGVQIPHPPPNELAPRQRGVFIWRRMGDAGSGRGRVRDEPGHPAAPPSEAATNGATRARNAPQRRAQASGSRSPTRQRASCSATRRCSSGPGSGPEALTSRQTACPDARPSYSDTHSSYRSRDSSSAVRPAHGQRASPDPERLGGQPGPVAVVGGAELDVERVRPQLGQQGPGAVRAGRRRGPRDDHPQPGRRAVHPHPEVRVASGELPHRFTRQALGHARLARPR